MYAKGGPDFPKAHALRSALSPLNLFNPKNIDLPKLFSHHFVNPKNFKKVLADIKIDFFVGEGPLAPIFFCIFTFLGIS